MNVDKMEQDGPGLLPSSSELLEQYRSIFESSLDAILIANLDGVIVEVNPAACDMYGYTYAEFIGMDAATIMHSTSRSVIAENLRMVVDRGSRHLSGLGMHKDGSPFNVEARISLFSYLGKPHALAVVRDITERVHAYELLEKRVESRTRELTILLRVAQQMSSTLELRPLLSMILDQLKSVVDFDGATIMAVEGKDLVNLYRLGPGDSEPMMRKRFPILDGDPMWEYLNRGEAAIIDDVWDDSVLAVDYRQSNGELMNTVLRYVRSWMGVPMIHKDRVIGMLTLASSMPHAYTQRHAALTVAVASQAAVAIENARLFQRAREAAVVEERQRLSRELHDSVSQVLYAIGLGANTARVLLPGDPEQALEAVEYVHSLAQAGLAEMRALIFDLRPDALEEEGLAAALDRQATAMQARHGIRVELDVAAEPEIALPIKEALYRIAQEALHNIVKHAAAEEARLSLRQGDGQIVLEISDNGRGFDAEAFFPGHLGLHSMRERAGQFDGAVDIESAPGKGVRIRACIPLG